MAGPTEEDAPRDSREGTRKKTNSCASRGGTETPVSHPSFGRQGAQSAGTFSLTDVAEKGDEGSGSLCPRGSSALDKQTQSPFLQGQGTRGTVKTSFSNPAPADAPFPRARRPMASVARRGLPGGRAGNWTAGSAARSALCVPRAG